MILSIHGLFIFVFILVIYHHTILTCAIVNVINLVLTIRQVVIMISILSTGLGSGGLNKR